MNEDALNLKDFEKVGSDGSFRRKLVRLLKHGYLLDVNVLEDFISHNLGDITFEEAYLLSNRILNITVSSSRKQEIPLILNYLTAPNVASYQNLTFLIF